MNSSSCCSYNTAVYNRSFVVVTVRPCDGLVCYIRCIFILCTYRTRIIKLNSKTSCQYKKNQTHRPTSKKFRVYSSDYSQRFMEALVKDQIYSCVLNVSVTETQRNVAQTRRFSIKVQVCERKLKKERGLKRKF